jgi:hypothetical protein
VTEVPKPVGLRQGSIETGEFAALRYDFEMVTQALSVPKARGIAEFVDIDTGIMWRKVVFDALPKFVDRMSICQNIHCLAGFRHQV